MGPVCGLWLSWISISLPPNGAVCSSVGLVSSHEKYFWESYQCSMQKKMNSSPCASALNLRHVDYVKVLSNIVSILNRLPAVNVQIKLMIERSLQDLENKVRHRQHECKGV